jgi:hypothetical protein
MINANSGRLKGFIVYFVWEPNWQQTIQTFMKMVGKPHPKMAVMIDVESWGGRITGNQSAGINAAREALIKWLGGNRNRVIGYGNAGDLNNLWPQRGDCNLILANYSSNPSFPNKIAHQFSSSYYVQPFGKCDINSADGYSPDQFATKLGLNMEQNHYKYAVHSTHDNVITDNTGSWALYILSDGRVELRHNGVHVGWVTINN